MLDFANRTFKTWMRQVPKTKSMDVTQWILMCRHILHAGAGNFATVGGKYETQKVEPGKMRIFHGDFLVYRRVGSFLFKTLMKLQLHSGM